MKKLSKLFLVTITATIPAVSVVSCSQRPTIINDFIPIELINSMGQKITSEFQAWFLEKYGNEKNPTMTYTDYRKFRLLGDEDGKTTLYDVFESKFEEIFEKNKNIIMQSGDYGENGIFYDVDWGNNFLDFPMISETEQTTLKNSFVMDDSVLTVGKIDLGEITFKIWTQNSGEYNGEMSFEIYSKNDWLVKKSYKELWDDNFFFHPGMKLFSNLTSSYDQSEVFVFNDFDTTFKETEFNDYWNEMLPFFTKMENWIGEYWWNSLKGYTNINTVRENSSWVFETMMNNFTALVPEKDSDNTRYYSIRFHSTGITSNQNYCDKRTTTIAIDTNLYCGKFEQFRETSKWEDTGEIRLELEINVTDANKGILLEDQRENFKIYLGTLKFEWTEITEEILEFKGSYYL